MNNLAPDPNELSSRPWSFRTWRPPPRLTIIIKGKKGTCLNGVHLPTTQLCKIILPPRPEKLKEKAKHAISEARLLFRERRHQSTPHKTAQAWGTITRDSPASCSRWEPGRVRPQFPHLSRTAGQRERLSPVLLLPKPSGAGVPRLGSPPGGWRWAAAVDVRSSSARGS